MMNTIIIGIAGGTGSGKTTLADKLVNSFGREEVSILRHDAYYKRHDNMTFEERCKLNYDHPDAFDNDLLVEHILDLKEGKSIEMPVYDYTIHNRSDETITVEPAPVVILEGILIFAEPTLCDLMDIKVFVDTDADVRILRRIIRDVNERGRSLDNIIRQYLTTVKPMHEQFVEPSKRRADLIIPEGGVGQGWQTVLRAKNIYGPYERRIVLEQGSTQVNGPHQGALVDTPDGKWWFYHFQETPVLGRVVHLQPAGWLDDWPYMGVDIDGNGVGEPVRQWQCPLPKATANQQNHANSVSAPREDFNSPLALQWQWNHNPAEAHWSLSERDGWLTLQALPADSLKACRNMLTQKVVGYRSESTTLVEARGNCFAGLFCSGKQFLGIGLCPQGLFIERNGERTLVKSGNMPKVYLRVTNDCRRNEHQFSYSTDGKHFVPVGNAFTMRAGYWKGIRVGVFCYGQEGLAQFGFFRHDVQE